MLCHTSSALLHLDVGPCPWGVWMIEKLMDIQWHIKKEGMEWTAGQPHISTTQVRKLEL